jgi:hypothetical protein
MFVILVASTIDKQINRPAHLYCCIWIFFGEPSARFFLLHLMLSRSIYIKNATNTPLTMSKSPTNHQQITY